MDPQVFCRIRGLHIVVAWAEGIDNRGAHPSVDQAWAAAWEMAEALASAWPNPQSHPRVQAWGEALKAAGISRKHFPPSVEAVLRRAMKRSDRFVINPLVDFYNAIALAHLVPAGAFDLDRIAGNIRLRLTESGDSFHGLDRPEPEPVPPGEIAYTAGSVVLTRQLMWRQAKAGLVTADTRTVLLMSELLPQHPPELAESVSTGLAEGLRQHFGVDPAVGRVDEAHPAFLLPETSRG